MKKKENNIMEELIQELYSYISNYCSYYNKYQNLSMGEIWQVACNYIQDHQSDLLKIIGKV